MSQSVTEESSLRDTGDPFEAGIKEVIRHIGLADGHHVEEELRFLSESLQEEIEAEKKIRDGKGRIRSFYHTTGLLSKPAMNQLVIDCAVGEPRYKDGSFELEWDTKILGPAGKPLYMQQVASSVTFTEDSVMEK